MDATFWKGKKVLITGHTGFKGSWLSLWLQTRGVNTIGYSLPPPTKPSLFEIGNISEGMVSIKGDVRDLDHLKTVIAEHTPEIVIHMAAQSLVRYSYSNPIETYSTNVMGTANVLEAIRQTDSVKVVLIITSDKCYENREWLWGYRENDPMGGHDPYSSSKGCAELVTSAYRSSYFSKKDYQTHSVALASARAGNVIGGGDWGADRLVPDIMSAFMANQPVVIRFSKNIRPWQYVLEPLSGYLTIAEKLWENGGKFAGPWNFGPNDQGAKSVSWVADNLVKLWGQNASWVLDKKSHPHEATYLKLDCSKAKSMLGWEPKLDLDTALKWTIEWYRGYTQNQDMRLITEGQISHYETMEAG